MRRGSQHGHPSMPGSGSQPVGVLIAQPPLLRAHLRMPEETQPVLAHGSSRLAVFSAAGPGTDDVPHSSPSPPSGLPAPTRCPIPRRQGRNFVFDKILCLFSKSLPPPQLSARQRVAIPLASSPCPRGWKEGWVPMAQEQGRVSCCPDTSQSATRERLSEATVPGPGAPVMCPHHPGGLWPLPGPWVWAHSFSSNLQSLPSPT